MKNVKLMSFVLLAFMALTNFEPGQCDNKSPGIAVDENLNIQDVPFQLEAVRTVQDFEISVVAEISEAPAMPLLMEIPKINISEYIGYIPDAPIYQVFHPCNS